MTMMEDMMKEVLAQKQANKDLYDSVKDLLKVSRLTLSQTLLKLLFCRCVLTFISRYVSISVLAHAMPIFRVI